MARASTEDPLKIFRFRVEVDDIVRAGFTEVTGLEKTVDTAEYREGGMNETPQKSAGLSKFSDITLKRGQIIGSSRGGDDDFIRWMNQVSRVAVMGNSENYRRDLDIVQYNSLNQEVVRWRVSNAFPNRHKPFGDLNGNGSDNSVEELVLAHEGFELVAR
jgi:phage tail-like protein